MDSERLKKQLDFLIEADKMKSLYRQTYIIGNESRGASMREFEGEEQKYKRRENDAEHSWHLSVMALALARYAARPVNVERVLKKTLIHDLVEVYAGDTFAFDAAATAGQKEREEAAADKIFAMIPEGAALRALWEEFDEGRTADASFAAALDRLQPLLANHLNEGHTCGWETSIPPRCTAESDRSARRFPRFGIPFALWWRKASKRDISAGEGAAFDLLSLSWRGAALLISEKSAAENV